MELTRNNLGWGIIIWAIVLLSFLYFIMWWAKDSKKYIASVQDIALRHCWVLYTEYEEFTLAIDENPDCSLTWIWEPANKQRQAYNKQDRDTLSTTFDSQWSLVVYDELDEERIQEWKAMISIDVIDTNEANRLAQDSIEYLKNRFWSSILDVSYVFPRTKILHDYIVEYKTDVWVDLAAISRYLDKNNAYTSQDWKKLLQVSPNITFVHKDVPTSWSEFSTQSTQEWILDQRYLEHISHSRALECVPKAKKKIRIAVVDNWFDLVHPDFSGVIWNGYDEADRDSDAQVPKIESAWNHGTKEAGIIWAEHNDFGVTWIFPNADLILVKATKDKANGRDITDGIQAIAKAYELGADVINLSWGWFNNVSMLEKVTKKVAEKWVIIVAAAWNYNKNKPFYPAAYDWVVGVAAIDDQDKKASFSNYGPWVDIAAPWVNMLTTDLNNSYDYYNGTSEASPVVAWSIALALSVWLEVDDIIQNTKQTSHENFWAGILDLWFLCDIGYTTQQIQDTHNVSGEPWLIDNLSRWRLIMLIWLLIMLLWVFGWLISFLKWSRKSQI